MSDQLRRVLVTSGEGPSTVDSDGIPPSTMGNIEGYGPMLATIWEMRGLGDYGDPAPNAPRLPAPGVTRVTRIIFDAGYGVDDPGMHRTDTIDVACVLEGQIELVLEKAGSITLDTGDFVVLRGDIHGWRNNSDRPCVIVGTMYGTEPTIDQH